MAPNAAGATQSRTSRLTAPRIAAFGIAAALGIAACSPSGASPKYSNGAAPTNTMAAGPMTMVPPSNTTPPAAPTPPAPAAAAKVSIVNFAFDAAMTTVKAGGTVVWTNNDVVAHTVTFTDVANSPILNRGNTFSRTFTSPGSYSYICSIHPFMHGTVVVTA
jgi:plastocyanin